MPRRFDIPGTLLVATAVAVLFPTAPLGGQQAALTTGASIVRDASQRVLAENEQSRPSTERRTLRVDEMTSAATAVKVASLASLPAGAVQERSLPSIPLEPNDAVMRCASRDGRNDAQCARITPRIVIAATAAEARADGSVVLFVSVVQWERASTASPPGYVALLRYVRAGDGTWRFDRVLGRAVG